MSRSGGAPIDPAVLSRDLSVGEAELVPVALTQPAVHRLKGDDFTEELVPAAKHETFNELDKDATIELVGDFAERVTGG